MATDYRSLLINLLQRYDPTLDLSSGSPIVTEVVDPMVSRLGPDPIDTPIDSLIYDRLIQEHPELAPVPGDAISDISINFMKTMLEPFRREIQNIRTGQILDPTKISDDEADAIVSNTFSRPRSKGGYSVGRVNVYFSNPMSITITADSYCYTADGRRYFPYTDQYISMQSMILNEEDGRYYISVYCQAENPGTGYDIDSNMIVGIYNVPNAVKVSNPDRFFGGLDDESTATLVARVGQDLTERSLNTAAGIAARFNYDYPGTFRFLEMVRHGDVDMDRDILTGSGGRDNYRYGLGAAFDDHYLMMTTFLETSTQQPSVGDRLSLLFPPFMYDNGTIPVPADRLEEFEIIEISDDVTIGALACKVARLDSTPTFHTPDEPPATPFSFSPTVYWLSRESPIAISDIPGGLTSSLVEVDPNEIHLGGHQDAYVSPDTRDIGSVAIPGLRDNLPLFSGQNLAISGPGTEVRLVPAFDFEANDVRPKDVVVIENGTQSGVYRVIQASGTSLYLDADPPFTAAEINLSFYITRWVKTELTDPMDIHLPFGSTPANTLSTIAGSPNLNTNGPSLLAYGADKRDTIRILTGSDAEDYRVEDFLAGVFSGSTGVTLPLVRTTKVELLDNASQPSGTRIPYARPVRVEVTSEFTGAVTKGESDLAILFPKELPDAGFFAILSTDTCQFPVNDPIAMNGAPDNIPDWVAGATGRTPFLVAFPNMPMDVLLDLMGFATPASHVSPSYPDPILYGAEVGQSITLKSGEYKGSYTIAEKFILNVVTTSQDTTDVEFNIVFIRFEEDLASPTYNGYPYHLAHLFIDDMVGDPDSRITTAFSALTTDMALWGYTFGGAPTTEEMLQVAGSLYLVDHSYGIQSDGVARCYMLEPTTMEFRNFPGGVNINKLVAETEAGERFLLSPSQTTRVYPERTITDSRDLPRDMSIYATHPGRLAFSSSDPYLDGMLVSDRVLVHEAVFKRLDVPVVTTVAGSNIITIPATLHSNFRNTRPGFMVSIGTVEEADTAEMYTVTEVVDAKTILVDRPIPTSTPPVSGIIRSGLAGNTNLVGTVASIAEAGAFVGVTTSHYVVITHHQANGAYTWDPAVLGKAYPITITGDPNGASFDVGTDTFPVGLWATADCHWMVLSSSESFPIAIPYDSSPTPYAVTSLSTYTVTRYGDADLTNYQGLYQPYYWEREHCTRISVSEMEDNNQYGLYYVDLVLQSEGENSSNNIPFGTMLRLVEDTYQSDGYVLEVENTPYAYSDQETVHILVRSCLLPSGEDDLDSNLILLPQQGIQVDYEYSELLSSFQAICEADADRICVANSSVRHTLPALVYITISYTGGSEPDFIVPIIQELINNSRTTGRLEVSDIEAEISKRGASFIDQDIHLYVVFWGRDRIAYAEHSTNYITGIEEVPFMLGSRRIAGYIAGPNRANEDGVVVGERTTLIKTAG
jgi:hypothetical protein